MRVQARKSLIANNVRRTILANRTLDPTRTLTLRNAFTAACVRRFRELQKVIRVSVVDRDCFALLPAPTMQVNMEATGYRQYEFNTSAEKVTLFMEWLRQQQDEGILEIVTRRQVGVGINEQWTDTFVRRAYEVGVSRADSELENIGVTLTPSPVSLSPVIGLPLASDLLSRAEKASAIIESSPQHLDRLGMAYTRTFTDLKGITEAMDVSISRTLAQGLLDGKSPIEISKDLLANVENIGIRRAKLLAQTEVIRTHHQAMMQEFKNYSILDVIVLAEYVTTNDGRVCPKCKALDGKRYTLDQAMNIIPQHPGCRCMVIPVPVEDDE